MATINFELRDVTTNSISKRVVDDVSYAVFSVTPVAGIIGNTYPAFLSSQTSVEFLYPTSMTGDEMNTRVGIDSAKWVSDNFPPLEVA